MNLFDYFFEYSKKLDKDLVLGSKETAGYREIYDKSLRLATQLNNSLGSGQKIIILSTNSVFFIVCYLAIFKSGNVCVPLDPNIEQETLNYILEVCNCKNILAESNVVKKYAIPSEINIVSEIIFDNLVENIEGNKDLNKDFPENNLAEIIFTSGSTGKPKGVMLSHKNIMANTASILEYLKLNENDIIEVVLPFYYCYGLSLLHTHIRIGGSIVMNNSFIFIGGVINDFLKYKCTGFAGVPSHFQILLRKTKSFKEKSFPHLRYVTQAGGKLHKAFISEFRECFPEIDFFVMYGQTEATARLSYLPPTRLNDKLGSIGQGIPGVTLDIFNEKGNSAQPKEIGEIVAKGDNVMLGYLEDPETTSQTLKNGWLYTGDIGLRDEEGFIYLTARKKEIIKVGGKRISPKEIEEVIVQIPEVIDCTIESVNDDLLGEAMKATLIVEKQHNPEEFKDKVKKYCSTKLPLFKIPQVIELKSNMKIKPTGKK